LKRSGEDERLSNKSDDKYPFSVNLDYMHPDDLKAIWICHECRMKFLFHSDVEDHRSLSGHKIVEKVMIVSPAKTLA
jgi:hypothetical protein